MISSIARRAALNNLRLIARAPFSILIDQESQKFYEELERKNPFANFARINDIQGLSVDSLHAMDSFLHDRKPDSLHLQDCLIDENSAEVVGKYVANGRIKTINIKSCQFSSDSYKILLNFAARSKSLNLLAIQGLSDPLADIVMADFFANSYSIRDAIFSFCDFGDNSLVVRSAKRSDSLELMNFSLAKKDDDLIDAIKYLLRDNFSLRALKLPLLEVDSKQVVELAKALRQNSYLEHFEISPKSLASHESLQEALEILSDTSSLEVIRFPLNKDDALEKKSSKIEKKNLAIKEAIIDYSKTILGSKLAKAIMDSKLDIASIDFKKYEETLFVMAKKILLKGLTNEEVVDIYQKWNSPFFRTKNGSLKDYNGASWPLLFGKKTIDLLAQDTNGVEGYSIAELSNPKELELNGVALRHCAGSYTSLCITGNHHVFALNFRGREIATIDFFRDDTRKTITQSDYSGIGDSSPPSDLKEIPQKIIDRFFKEVDFDSLRMERLKRESQRDSFAEAATSVIGFDVRDGNRVASLFRLFRRCGLVGLKKNFDELLRCQSAVTIIDSYGEHKLNLALMGRCNEHPEYKALSIEEARENARRNQEIRELQIPDIQKNIDRIYGAKKIIAKRDESGFGTVALSFEEGCEELASEIKSLKAFRGHRLETLQDGTLVARIGIKKLQEMFKKIAEKRDPSSDPHPASGLAIEGSAEMLFKK